MRPTPTAASYHTELGNVIETGPVEAGLQLIARPAPHHELVVARALLTIVDEGMPFGQEELPVLADRAR